MQKQDDRVPGCATGIRKRLRTFCCCWSWVSVFALLLGQLAMAQSIDGLTVATSGNQPNMKLAPAQISPIEEDFILTHPVLRIAVAGVEYPPYQTINNGVIGGYSIRFLEAIAKANGFQVDYQVYATWGEVLDALKTRKADMTPSAAISRDRRQYMDFTAGITPDPAGLVGLQGDDRILSDPSLAGMRVAVGREFVAESYLKDQFPKSIPVGVESTSEALEMIVAGSVDYYYGPLANVFFAPDQGLASKVEIKQRVYFSTGWTHIGIRSDWPIVKRLFDRFVKDGRDELDPELSNVIGEELESVLPRLQTTPEETAYLRNYTSLRVGTISGFPLFNDIDTEGRHTGIASEFTAYLAYQMGVPVELTRYDSIADLIDGLLTGQIDVIPYLGITAERQKSMRFSDPYLTMPWLAVGRGGDDVYWDLESLGGKTLAVRKRHPLLPIVRSEYPELQLRVTETAGEEVDAVVDGEADVFIETKLYVNRVLSEQATGALRVLGEVKDDPGLFGFAVNPENAALVPIINKALASVPRNFTERVIRRWVAVDFSQDHRFRFWLSILVPALVIMGLFLVASLYWNRRTASENERRVKAEQRLIDMTERLRTGVFQFRQCAGQPAQLEFSNKITRHMGRVSEDAAEERTLQFFEFIDSEDVDHIRERLAHSLKTGEHFRETFRFEFPEGERGWIVCDAHCREQSDGARIWSGYLFDMTSERMLTEELNALLADRDEFVSMASHELRTPIQNVSTSLDLIQKKALDSGDQKTLERAKSACRDLEELVNDIVQMSGMNHHSPVLSRDPLDLNELVNTVCKSFAATASRKSIDYSVSPDTTLPTSLSGDALRIKQVLYNLIGNAVKYTDRGGISVSVDTIGGHQSPDERLVAISVSDTGMGIAQEQLARIFEPFATVGPASRRSSGLGLALSDRLVAVMGGQIRVNSTLGEGSTFTVELPLQLARAQGQKTDHRDGTEQLAPREREPLPDTLLLVDDNLLVREAMADMLQARGWTIYKADSAFDALEMTRSRRIKAVVTDQQMPGMTGIDLAREIRADAQNGRARPVLILMSGGMSRENSARAASLFDAMLFKPVKAEQIRSAVDGVIDRWHDDESRMTSLAQRESA